MNEYTVVYDLGSESYDGKASVEWVTCERPEDCEREIMDMFALEDGVRIHAIFPGHIAAVDS